MSVGDSVAVPAFWFGRQGRVRWPKAQVTPRAERQEASQWVSAAGIEPLARLLIRVRQVALRCEGLELAGYASGSEPVGECRRDRAAEVLRNVGSAGSTHLLGLFDVLQQPGDASG